MLTIDLVDEFLHRANVDDCDFKVLDINEGEVLTAVDPDADFSSIRESINNYPPYLRSVKDNGVDYIEVEIYDYFDGYKTKLSYLFSKGDSGIGVKVKVAVKLIDCSVDGKHKYFTSFDSLNKYIELNSKEG